MKVKLTVILFLILLTLMVVTMAASRELVAQVSGRTVKNITVPVVHDTTGRTDADLTDREKHFLSTVPETRGLRDAVHEMLLANVCHVPEGKCGNYVPGSSVHYWEMYQSWTGPAKVTVPLIPGPRGKPGPPGPPGPSGTPTMMPNVTMYNYNYNYTFGNSATPSYQLGGNYAPVVVSTGIASLGWAPVSRINITNTAIAKAPTSIDIDVSQQQQQQQEQQQAVAIDP